MKKYKSLFYRELRLSMKNTVITAVTVVVFALFFFTVSYVVKNLSLEDTNSIDMQNVYGNMVLMSSAFLGLLPAMMNLGQSNILRSDINSGWLQYSFSLPITSKERAFTRTVRSAFFTVVGMLFGLLCTVGYCAVAEVTFSVKYPVMYCIILAAAQISGIITDFFVFSARNTEQLKKMQQRAGFILLAFMIAAAFFVFKVSSIGNSQPGVEILNKLNAGMLIWLIPLILILTAADFFVVSKRLEAAYSSVGRITKEKAEVSKELSDGGHPTGFFYKELKQNRIIIAFVAALPLLMMFLSLVMTFVGGLTENKTDFVALLSSNDSNLVYSIMIAVGAFFASSFISGIFFGDDRKLLAYFIVSTPQGVKGYLYNKFVVCFALNGIYMISWYFTNDLYNTIKYAITGEETDSIASIFIMLFFLLLFVCTVDIPFIIRFGQKKGGYIKTVAMLIAATLLVIGFAILPEAVQDELMQIFDHIRQGKADDVIMLIVSVLPLIIMSLYMLSYRISCKVFMKGVENYDK
ncbi:MAG: ABC-2 transporter permease [Ruminiclostridium sp.]|nr:ABC-2 transporter permease [Ruminiclostridium sp.]